MRLFWLISAHYHRAVVLRLALTGLSCWQLAHHVCVTLCGFLKPSDSHEPILGARSFPLPEWRQLRTDPAGGFSFGKGFRMMKKTVFLSCAALLTLSACDVPTVQQREVLNSMIGKTDVDVLRTFGVPSRTYQASGHDFLAYIDNETNYSPAQEAGVGAGVAVRGADMVAMAVGAAMAAGVGVLAVSRPAITIQRARLLSS